MALPKLYGAPAYARPTVVPVRMAERPFSPDDLPLESELSQEEREVFRAVAGRHDPVGPDEAAPHEPGSSEEGIPYPRGVPRMVGVRPSRIRGIGSILRGGTRDGTGG